MLHAKAVVVLETMWGDPKATAPGFFRINPYNHSGRRLYWLLGHEDFWVTNACRELVSNARQHGTPDPDRLAKNLQRLTYDLLLVCGKVAQRTYRNCGYEAACKTLFMPHPAARSWTKASLAEWRQKLEAAQCSLRT
jgi:hypothetical protein